MTINQSLAEKFLDETLSEEDPYQWIIVYDFIQEKPSPKFWKNLQKLMSITTLTRIQYSVLMAEKKGEAQAAEKLALYYGAVVEVFRCIRQGGLVNTNRLVNTTPPPGSHPHRFIQETYMITDSSFRGAMKRLKNSK